MQPVRLGLPPFNKETNLIRVTIELIPLGFENRKKTIGELTIVNDGTGSQTSGNYQVTLMKSSSKRIWKLGTVKNFPRKRLGPYDLLLRALQDCIGVR
jgi:hypothetical protein